MAGDAADELYALPLEEFVPARDAMARELRREKRRDEATAVAALAKPSRPAWMVNRLAREEAALMAKLLECAEALEAAQEAAVSGEGASDLRAATRAERKAVDQLLAAARELRPEGRRPSAAILERVRVTLQAGAGDPALRELMRAGCVVEEPAAGGAWPMMGLAAEDAGAESRAPSRPSTGGAAPKRARKRGEREEKSRSADRERDEDGGRARRARTTAGEGEDGDARAGTDAAGASENGDGRGGDDGDGREDKAAARERAEAQRRADEEEAARRRELKSELAHARKTARDAARERDRAQRDAERAADRLERLAAEVDAAREAAEGAAERRNAAQAEASAADEEVARLEGELRGS